MDDSLRVKNMKTLDSELRWLIDENSVDKADAYRILIHIAADILEMDDGYCE